MPEGLSVHKKGAFSLQDAIVKMKKRRNFANAGAIAAFVGVVRGKTLKNERVGSLRIEAYDEKANEVLASICADLRKRPGIVDVQIDHLSGEFQVGEDLVYVLVAGSHRKDVFKVLEEAVERYKKEAPIFKKEQIVTRHGKSSYWVDEKNLD